MRAPEASLSPGSVHTVNGPENGSGGNGLRRQAVAASDPDVAETREWLDSLDGVIQNAGTARAAFLLAYLRIICSRQIPNDRSLAALRFAEQPENGDRDMPADFLQSLRKFAISPGSR